MRTLDEELEGDESGEEQNSHSSSSSSRISSPLSLPTSIDDDHHFPLRPPDATDNERHDDHHDEIDDDTQDHDLGAQIAVLQAQQHAGESDRARLEEQVLRFQQHQQEHQQEQQKEQSSAQDLAEIRKQLKESQRCVVGLSDQLDFHIQENERLAKETGTLRAETQATAKELKAAQTKLQRQAQKEGIYDDTAARLDAAEKANSELQAQSTQHAAALAQATAAHDSMQRRVAEAAHCQDMLVLDKAFLSKEIEKMKAEHSATQRALQISQEKTQKLSFASEEWSQQLQKVKEEAQRAYQLRLDEERCRLTAEQAGNRTTSQEVWERETTMLREARQEALLQADRSRQELHTLQQAHEDLVLHLAKQDTIAQATMAALRAEAKCKAYELARIEALLEEKGQALSSSQEAVATVQTQYQDQRDACVRLEARANQKEHELALALEKVQSYEVLETQLDAAVTSLRTRGRRGGVVRGREDKPWIGSVPRRMQHAILLATRLRDRDDELAVVRREQQRVQEEAEGLRRQVGELQQLLHHSSQPGRYVVELLREKEREVKGVRQQWQVMKMRVDEAQVQVQQLQREREREREREAMQRQWQRREGGRGNEEGGEEEERRRRLNQRLAKHLLPMTRPPCGSGTGPRWHMKR